MKECYWCKKSCLDSEEGGFEIEPDSNKEVGWICDHCVLKFDGKCDCAECKENDKVAKKAVREYDLAHPKKNDWGATIGCVCLVFCFAGLLWLWLFKCIVEWL